VPFCQQYGFDPIVFGHDLADPIVFGKSDPSWGRMSAEQRNQFTHDLATIQTTLDLPLTKPQRVQVAWLAANFAFALRLDEVSRQLEPAYRMKQRLLVEKISPTEIAPLLATAKASLQSAPLESLFQVYASRVRSRGELGVLSSLNQRLWLQYRELKRFTDSFSTPPGGGGEPKSSPESSPARRMSP
jgi:hypothetical protein